MLDILGLYRFMRRQDGTDARKHGYNENPPLSQRGIRYKRFGRVSRANGVLLTERKINE